MAILKTYSVFDGVEVAMALVNSDFWLTDKQLDQVNSYIAESSGLYRQVGEDPGWGIKIVFEWSPGLGRAVEVYFDGAIAGKEIS